MVLKPPDLLRDAMLDTRDPLLDTEKALSDTIAVLGRRMERLEGNSPRDALDTGIARRAAAQSIPNNTKTAVILDIEDDDTANFFDIAANPTRLSFPYTGVFLVTATVDFASNATGRRELGVEPAGGGIQDIGTNLNAVSGTNTQLHAVIITKRSGGDFYEFFVIQNSGGALHMSAGKISVATLRDDT